MKKYNLDALFHDAIEYNVCMTDSELILLDRKHIEFDLDELQEKYEALKNYYRFPRTKEQKRELQKLNNQIVNLKASLFHKAWN